MTINIQSASTSEYVNEPFSGSVVSDENFYIPKITSQYIEDLNSNEFVLRKPMQLVVIQEEDGSYVAQHVFLKLWAESKSKIRAINSLKSKILHLYKKLKSLSSDELGPFPQECLEYLDYYIS